MSDDDKHNLKRRDFLRGAGLAAGAAAGVAGLSAAPAAADVPPAEAATGGYRETEHVRRVYDTARF